MSNYSPFFLLAMAIINKNNIIITHILKSYMNDIYLNSSRHISLFPISSLSAGIHPHLTYFSSLLVHAQW